MPTIEEMIQDCEDFIGCSNCTFTPWEVDFIDDIKEWFDENNFLTEKQEDVLSKIWDKI